MLDTADLPQCFLGRTCWTLLICDDLPLGPACDARLFEHSLICQVQIHRWAWYNCNLLLKPQLVSRDQFSISDLIAVNANRDQSQWSVLLSSDTTKLSMQRTTAVTAACCDLTVWQLFCCQTMEYQILVGDF